MSNKLDFGPDWPNGRIKTSERLIATGVVWAFSMAAMGFLAFRDQRKRMRSYSIARGEPVWYSYNRNWGIWKHVVVYVHGLKFEIRIDDERGLIFTSKAEDLPAGIQIDHKHAATIPKTSRPKRMFEYRFLGTTTLDASTVQGICTDLFNGFGTYNMISNNCQHFAKDIAESIISEAERAHDYAVLSSGLARRLKFPLSPAQFGS